MRKSAKSSGQQWSSHGNIARVDSCDLMPLFLQSISVNHVEGTANTQVRLPFNLVLKR